MRAESTTRAIAVCLIVSSCFGCATSRAPTPPTLPPEEVAPRWAAQVDGLERLHATGLLEARWTEEGESHAQQGDMETWIAGRDVSMRITKFGDVVLWLGDTSTSSWRFDMMAEPSRLDLLDGANGKVINAADLRVLLGVDPMPEDSTVVVEDGLFVARWTVGGASVVTRIDPATLHPIHVVMTNPQGNSKEAVHRWRIGRTPITGAPGGRALARIVDIESTRDDVQVSFKLRFSTAEALDEATMQDRSVVFDVERLRAHLRPEEVKLR